MYKSLGAVPVSIPYSELYTSLQTGMVQGQDNCFLVSDADGLCETLNSAAIVNHFYAAGVVVCSETWLNGLSKEDKELIVSAAKEAGKKQREWTNANEGKLIDKYKEEGWTITYPEDIEDWKTAVKPIYEKYLAGHEDWKNLVDIVDSLR
ncbi:MAG TPA: TRAP transporter substrate-binding protein DctP, partial [Clostridia bacterium]|nr:TRAP transporter substrate-binding protein DctP [Clostridia bacterium]